MMRLVECPFPIVVTGGRDYGNRTHVFDSLDQLHYVRQITLLGHGACMKSGEVELRGADRWAHEWALSRIVPSIAYPADWEKYGDRAGPVRNQALLDLIQPKCCVAFPGGRGTSDMVGRCRSYRDWHLQGGCYVLEIGDEQKAGEENA